MSPQFICVLTIGRFIYCLIINYSGSDSLDISKRRNLDLKGSGVSHKNKGSEEDEPDVPSKDNKSEREKMYERCIVQ